MDLHSCQTCRCSAGIDLRASGRRGPFWASVLCVIASLAVAQLAARATDDVHRVMFGVLATALGVAALVLQIARVVKRSQRRSA